jgi:transcriptional regulator with XRE-family HTH domain
VAVLASVFAGNPYPSGMLTPAQMRAARGLLGWSQRELAIRAGLPLGTIKNIERGASDPRASTLAAIEKAFIDARIILMEPGDVRDGGQGVRWADKP